MSFWLGIVICSSHLWFISVLAKIVVACNSMDLRISLYPRFLCAPSHSAFTSSTFSAWSKEHQPWYCLSGNSRNRWPLLREGDEAFLSQRPYIIGNGGKNGGNTPFLNNHSLWEKLVPPYRGILATFIDESSVLMRGSPGSAWWRHVQLTGGVRVQVQEKGPSPGSPWIMRPNE